MRVERAEHSKYLSSSYLIGGEGSGNASIVDGHGEGAPLIIQVREYGLDVTMILLTHYHFDHAGHRGLPHGVRRAAGTRARNGRGRDQRRRRDRSRQPARVAVRTRNCSSGPDHDGTNEAWVRMVDGGEAVVGGSQVQR